MRVSSLNVLAAGDVELGVVYASVEGVNENSYEECLEQLISRRARRYGRGRAATGAKPVSVEPAHQPPGYGDQGSCKVAIRVVAQRQRDPRVQ